MAYDPTRTYSKAFLAYLGEAQVTGFDFYLTAQDVGVDSALRTVEDRIKREERRHVIEEIAQLDDVL